MCFRCFKCRCMWQAIRHLMGAWRPEYQVVLILTNILQWREKSVSVHCCCDILTLPENLLLNKGCVLESRKYGNMREIRVKEKNILFVVLTQLVAEVPRSEALLKRQCSANSYNYGFYTKAIRLCHTFLIRHGTVFKISYHVILSNVYTAHDIMIG
jgi:hypothetical protein